MASDTATANSNNANNTLTSDNAIFKNSNLIQTTLTGVFHQKKDGPEWQKVPELRYRKKRKMETPSPKKKGNRYELLNDEGDEETDRAPPKSKSPPIFLYGIENFQDMRQMIETSITKEEYTYKTVRGKQTIINTNTIEAHKKVLQTIREANLIHHTFPSREERSFRVVLKGIHPTDLDENFLTEELKTHGHIVKKVVGMKNKKTNKPLPIHFVNLELKNNNKNIYDVKYLHNVRINFEPVKNRVKREDRIVQCFRCQKFGHTKNYCYHPPRCVKCGQDHLTADCQKGNETPASCALCLEDHPANYKGCKVRQEILQRRLRRNGSPYQPREFRKNDDHLGNIRDLGVEPDRKVSKMLSYADVTQGEHTTRGREDKLENKLELLIQQMNNLMTLLTTIVNKLCK